jgi:hypothetical protein
MMIRFQADADLNQVIVTGVLRRERAIDFQTASVAGLKGLKDAEVLELAANQQRILVTFDQRTMPDAFARFISKRRSYGVLIASRKTPVQIIIEELILIWSLSDDDEWIDRIAKLPL